MTSTRCRVVFYSISAYRGLGAIINCPHIIHTIPSKHLPHTVAACSASYMGNHRDF